MRFPRIHCIRWDKPYREADTLESLEKLLTSAAAVRPRDLRITSGGPIIRLRR